MANKQAYSLLKEEDVNGFNKWVEKWRKTGIKSIDLDDKDLSGLKLKIFGSIIFLLQHLRNLY